LSNDVRVLNFPAAVAVATMSLFVLARTAFSCEGTLADADGPAAATATAVTAARVKMLLSDLILESPVWSAAAGAARDS
jgi:hypothetical protein